MGNVLLKTFLLIFLFFAFLFLGLETIQSIYENILSLFSLEVGPQMLSVGQGIALEILMFVIFAYFIFLTYSMMDSAIGVWVYKENVEIEFDSIVERSIDWSFYKLFRALQVPLCFLGVILLFAFMMVNFFNLICAFGGVFISICSFFFSLIMMLLFVSFLVCSMMLIFNSMFLFWGDDLVIINPKEENSEIFELSRRFFFMKKANLSLSVLTFIYLIGLIIAITAYEANKMLLLSISIFLFFILKYLKSWLLDSTFSEFAKQQIMQKDI